MKDFYGNELVTGWYWYSSNGESDIFHPVKIYPNEGRNGIAYLDGKPRPLSGFANVNLFKAEMPASK